MLKRGQRPNATDPHSGELMLCSLCRDLVIHARGPDGRTIAVDATPTPRGGLVFHGERLASPSRFDLQAGKPLYRRHARTCAERRQLSFAWAK